MELLVWRMCGSTLTVRVDHKLLQFDKPPLNWRLMEKECRDHLSIDLIKVAPVLKCRDSENETRSPRIPDNNNNIGKLSWGI